MSIEAMKQALDALQCIYSPLYVREIAKVGSAIYALRNAIEQAEKQEPVAWIWDVPVPNGSYQSNVSLRKPSSITCLNVTPLYTHPPKHEWTGLTDDNVAMLVVERLGPATLLHKEMAPIDIFEAGVRAAEAKLKELNT